MVTDWKYAGGLGYPGGPQHVRKAGERFDDALNHCFLPGQHKHSTPFVLLYSHFMTQTVSEGNREEEKREGQQGDPWLLHSARNCRIIFDSRSVCSGVSFS